MNKQNTSAKNNKKSRRRTPKDLCTHLVSVLIAGFPPETAIKDVRYFLSKIAPDQKTTLIKGPKNTFRGFLFIHFKQMNSANNFAAINHYFGDK